MATTRSRGPARPGSKKTYKPPATLEIPDEVATRFAEKDYALRWIRIKTRNVDDFKQISKRTREGYSFVKVEEVEDLVKHLGLTINPTTGMVVNGDVALAKIKFEDKYARQEYYETMARNQELAFMHDLEKTNNRTMPIHNDSRSVTRTGRSAEFRD